MKSMTSYAKTALSSGKNDFFLSMRTLNSRFLEAHLHLDKELYPYEMKLKNLLQNYIFRGRVDIHIQIQPREEKYEKLKLNEKALKEWLKVYRSASRACGLPPDFSLQTILQIPKVVTISSSSSWLQERNLPRSEEAVLFKAFHELCAKAVKERQREGKALNKNLHQLHTQLHKRWFFLEQRHGRLRQGLMTKLQRKTLSEQERESLKILLDKSDMQEELFRLKEHLKVFGGILRKKGGEALGKKLDFYAQEFLREVNTMGSKSNCAKMTYKVVESKALIESIREQLQNIE